MLNHLSEDFPKENQMQANFGLAKTSNFLYTVLYAECFYLFSFINIRVAQIIIKNQNKYPCALVF